MSVKATNKGTQEWEVKKIPQFDGKRAFILGGAFFGDVVNLLASAGFERAVTVEDSDLVVFIGGSDIDPKLYSEDRLSVSHWNTDRDTIEQFHYNKAKRLKKPMFGICRGAQFLWAMNGGKLWQDVNNHAGSRHSIVDIEEDVRVMANSYHHQMLQLNREMEDVVEIIAVCEEQVATRFTDANLVVELAREGANSKHELEIEAASIINSGCFFVQGHPEVGSLEYKTWTLHKLFQFMADFETFKQNEENLEITLTLH